MRCSLTRVIAFHATHRYQKPAWDDATNRSRFGWTTEAPGHGHLYRVEATVGGPLDAETQMVIDLPILDRILTEEITERLAGRHIPDAIPEFAPGAQLPTCEALASWCFQRIRARLPDGVTLVRVRVAEDSTLWADCEACPD